MNHISYQHIDNPKKSNIKKVDPNTKCNCFEKIHGCNMGLHIFKDGTIKFASRSQWINNSVFMGLNTIKSDLIKKAKLLANLIEIKDRVIIFGEFFGGIYPGLNIRNYKDYGKNEYVHEIKKIQKGVYYCPQVEFFAFDLCFIENGKKEYKTYSYYKPLFDQINMHYLKPIFSGTLAECSKFDVESFQTTIPGILGIEPIIENNYAEGIVVKPEENIYIQQHRFIVKIKRSSFSDKQKVTIKSISNDDTNEANIIVQEISQYINNNTLNSVLLNKFPGEEIEKINIRKLGGMIVSDAVDTYKRDTEKDLPDHNRKLITRLLMNIADKLVKENLKDN